MTETVELLQTFRFAVTLTRNNPGEGEATLGTGGFSECSGLELEADVKEYLEGGRNDGVVRRVGRVKLMPIVLKRGMFVPQPTNGDTGAEATADAALWAWLTSMVSGVFPVPRYDGEIELRDPADERAVARWTFDRGLPLKVHGPTLNAKTGDIAVEELHIAHEGLRLGDRP